MGNQKVDRAEMEKAAGEIDTSAGNITKIQTTLNDGITSLIGKGWEGNAAKAFLKGYEKFDEEFGKVQKELTNIHSKLSDSKMKYEQTEQENQESANEIDAMINSM